MSPLTRYMGTAQGQQIVENLNKRISSEVQSSEQCDSLGQSTERVLIGSLLTPDEEIPNGDVSSEVEIQDAKGSGELQIRQKVLIKNDNKVEQTQLEEVVEIQSAEVRSQSAGSHSA